MQLETVMRDTTAPHSAFFTSGIRFGVVLCQIRTLELVFPADPQPDEHVQHFEKSKHDPESPYKHRPDADELAQQLCSAAAEKQAIDAAEGFLRKQAYSQGTPYPAGHMRRYRPYWIVHPYLIKKLNRQHIEDACNKADNDRAQRTDVRSARSYTYQAANGRAQGQ